MSAGLELGLIWMPRDIREAVRIARLADQHGFAALGICDSPVLYEEVYPVVAACLAATESIRIGPNVTNPVTRHWTIHAASLRANDRLAPGRAMLGIGPGDGAVHSLGLRPATDEALETAVREIRAAAPDRGEIHLAAGGPRRARLAGRVADAALLGTGLDPGALQMLGDALDRGRREEAGEAAARTPRWAMAHLNVVDRGSEVEAARESMKPLAVTNARHAFSGSFACKNVPEEMQAPFRERLARYRFSSHAVPGGGSPNAALLADRPELERYAMERFTIVGTRAECRAQVERLSATGDLDGLWFSIVVPEPEALVDRAAEAFADLLGQGGPGASSPAESERRATVETMLAAAGLTVGPSELDELVATHRALKPRIEKLYALPEARYEQPALSFRAQPPLDAWGEAADGAASH